MKRFLILAMSALYFTGCPDSSSSANDHLYFSDTLIPYVDGHKHFTKDSSIYFKDSRGFTDEIRHSISFTEDDIPSLKYEGVASTMPIELGLRIDATTYGGSIFVTCGEVNAFVSSRPIDENDQDNPFFKSEYKDSVSINDTYYKNVLILETPQKKGDSCNVGKFYYAAREGIIRIVAKNGTNIDRISKKMYQEIKDKRIEDAARADSIQAAIADSVAKAVADSIIKANSQPSDTSDGTIISQEVIDAAESIADCIKKAYAAGSLTAIKDCKI